MIYREFHANRETELLVPEIDALVGLMGAWPTADSVTRHPSALLHGGHFYFEAELADQ